MWLGSIRLRGEASSPEAQYSRAPVARGFVVSASFSHPFPFFLHLHSNHFKLKEY